MSFRENQPEETPNEIEAAPEEKKLEIIGSDSAHAATFVIRDEDHTLGNSLRHVLAQDERVELVGYSIPHPLDNKLHLRIQTLRYDADRSPSNFSAVDALQFGCEGLKSRADHMRSVFDQALNDFRNEQVQ